ncbi:hypothetical protein F750_6180 [Streptomyces sp. PAMC 26508]|nr:hypothetical protein F750_6180 [Streptomyces sp. PAMC 26508]
MPARTARLRWTRPAPSRLGRTAPGTGVDDGTSPSVHCRVA